MKQSAIQTTTQFVKQNLTEQEATVYGPSVHWFRRARWKGDGPKFIKLANKVLYPVEELERYFSERLVRSTSEATVRQQQGV